MIIVKIWGGLGNQMFQYSFGKALSLKLNCEFKIDVKTENSARYFTSRNIGLSDFNVNLHLANNSEIEMFRYCNSGIISRIERKLTQTIPLLNGHYCVEAPLKKSIEIGELKDNCYYDGYWQSYRYFALIETILRDEFDLIGSLKDEIGHLIYNIENSESVSIHIRRGDYIAIKKHYDNYGVCDMEYYRRAINYMERHCSNPSFYIFSDDIDWAQSNFVGSQYEFISGNKPSQDMYLMSKCRHNIIANSTFSWWGAWLNRNSNKIVVAPNQWHKSKDNSRTIELISKSWIRQ